MNIKDRAVAPGRENGVALRHGETKNLLRHLSQRIVSSNLYDKQLCDNRAMENA